MATVFLLGPSEWERAREGATPMDVRRALAKDLRGHGHRVILMEDERDVDDEDLVAKFDRLLAQSTDVVLFWPVGAKMSTTYTEMVLLRKAFERGALPRLWFLHHAAVARIAAGRFEVLERGARSRYLTSLARLAISPIPWSSIEDLREKAQLLAGEL